ncbi:MAG TPA: Clp protease N-terminal domain-containing protein [Nocardioidaceae bacterium]|nr:Clp protease N-terminal domain-containing protein [Nocardioidaceae bacterium]
MLERFTAPARSTVEGAREHAVASTAGEVRPEHLLMALLDRRGCLAVRVVAELGATADEVRRSLDRHRLRYVDGLDEDDAEALRAIGIDLDEVVRRIDRNLGGLRASTPKRLPFSRPAKKVLELALREAIALRHNYIGTEHLLLGLARCDDRVVADTLAELGLERGRLRAAVADAVREAG